MAPDTVSVTNIVAEEVESTTHQNANLCYQCMRCSSGCPMAEHFDLLPSEVMRAIQEGDETVADSRTVWLCASCQTCNTRCPQELDIPGIIDHFRQATIDNASVPETARFFKAFLRNAKLFGRIFEAGLMGELNLREGKPFRDLGMGLRMIRKGKIKLVPGFTRLPSKVSKVFKTNGKDAARTVAYYPGCSLHSTGASFDSSFKAVSAELGIELAEIEGWTCCGTTPVHGAYPVKSVSMPLGNLAVAEQMGLDRVVAPCAACYGRFKTALSHYRRDGELADRVDRDLGRDYTDSVEVLNALDLLGEIDLKTLEDQVKRPLAHLKVACYYGCLLTRPPSDTGVDEPENPTQMERLVRAMGGEALDWSRKTDCCGGSLAISHTEVAKSMTAEILKEANARGADLIAVACPLCQVNLDERQPEMEDALGFTIPVVYITQLMAVALGLPEDASALDQPAIVPEPLLSLEA
jgi:heterodisulfide reductase subunit B